MLPVRMTRSDSRKRHLEIERILVHHGFDWLWSEVGIGKVFGGIGKRLGSKPKDPETQPVRLRLTLEELGTTAIKLGQMLSTRPDLLPPEYITELSKLQDHAPAVPFEAVCSAIQEQLGAPAEEVFQSFEIEPRAAGSIAQVHAATLQDGTKAVVKVRRPGIELLVEQDLSILGQIARFMAHNTALGKQMDLQALVDEFGNSLRNELDFAREGHNAERIDAQFVDDPTVHVPAVYWDFSTHCVLTMEDVIGIKIDDLEALDAAGIDRRVLAERCAHIALVQVLDNGFFHADPHPGNFFVQSDASISLIDYGMVGRLGEPLRESLLRLAMAASHRDSQRIVDELLGLGAAHGPVDRKSLARDIDHILERYDGQALGQVSAAGVFRDITGTAQRYSLRLPTDLVILTRVIAMDEGLGARLDPDFNLMHYATPYLQSFWKKNHSLKSIAEKVKEGAIDMAELASDLPERLLRLSGMVERGELTVTSRFEHQEQAIKEFNRAANRIAVSVLIAGIVMGLSIVAFRPETAGGLSGYLAETLLLAGLVAGAWLARAFWKSGQ